jgi:cytidylate kinase
MTVITITGLTGSGAPEIGADVAQRLNIDYVDRLILAEAARKMGATVAAVADKTERPVTFGDKISSFLRTVLERSAMAAPGSDPYFGPGMDAMLVREYREMSDEAPITTSDEIDDTKLLEVTRAVMEDLATAGNVAIIGRGANILLKDWPGALHVGLVSPVERRVAQIVQREQLGQKEAEKFVADNDRGRVAYFQRFLNVKPGDPLNYDITLNMDRLSIVQAGSAVAQLASLRAAN